MLVHISLVVQFCIYCRIQKLNEITYNDILGHGVMGGKDLATFVGNESE